MPLEKFNIDKSYKIGSVVVLVITVTLYFTGESPAIGVVIGRNIAYHAMYHFISFIPRLAKDLNPPERHHLVKVYQKWLSYAIFVFSLLVVIVALGNMIFLNDVAAFFSFAPALGFPLGAINMLRASQTG